MAMQLGSAGNMFDTPNPSRELQLWQENNRQNQELQMRQQQLQANLASQQLQDQTTQLQNARLSTGNQFDLDSYQTRLEGLTEQLTGTKIDNSLKASEAIYRPDLWRTQLKGAEAQTDLTKMHVSALRQSLQMDKDKFELAKRAADQEFAAGEINNAFKSLQMPSMITEQAQKIQMNAAQLRSQTLQNILLDKQAKGFDMSQSLGRFADYQKYDPSMRKVLKKVAPEIYGDLPDNLEEDDIKTMNNAIGVLRFLKEDPAMMLMGKTDPAQAQIRQAAMKLLDTTFKKASERGKTDNSFTIEEGMARLAKLTKSSVRKNGDGSVVTTSRLLTTPTRSTVCSITSLNTRLNRTVSIATLQGRVMS
jgi:multidrug efflux pump subunit AcrA (membrane-fusion protein)